MAIDRTLHWQLYRTPNRIQNSVTQYLTDSTHGSVFQSSQWFNVTGSKQNECIAIAAITGNKVVFAALVEKSQLPWTKHAYGHIHRGPVFDDIDQAISLWPEFEEILKKEKVCGITIQPFWERRSVSLLTSFLESRGFFVSSEKKSHSETLVIDLRRSIDEIFKKDLNSMRRGRIRKALKTGIQVEPVKRESEMIAFWRMYKQMSRRKGLKFWPVNKFNEVYQYSRQHPSQCYCLLGWLQGEILGGAIILKHSKTAEFYKGASTSKQMKGVPKTELIHWEAIKLAQKNGALFYDLGGYTKNAEKGSQEWGINKFKKGFTQQRMSLFKPMEKVFNPVPFHIYNSLKTTKNRLSKIVSPFQDVQ